MSATALYRLFDQWDQLLYVGISNNPRYRLTQHSCQPGATMTFVRLIPLEIPAGSQPHYDPLEAFGYCRRFWLPTLGPTAFLLGQELAQALGEGELEHDAAELSLRLGLGPREGRQGPLFKAFTRLATFRLGRAWPADDGGLQFAALPLWPALPRRNMRRLSGSQEAR